MISDHGHMFIDGLFLAIYGKPIRPLVSIAFGKKSRISSLITTPSKISLPMERVTTWMILLR